MYVYLGVVTFNFKVAKVRFCFLEDNSKTSRLSTWNLVGLHLSGVRLDVYWFLVATSGVELGRKSPRATWAREKKNLRAQLHMHEPNIMSEIWIFISFPHLFHAISLAEMSYTAGSCISFCISVHINNKVWLQQVMSLHLQGLPSPKLGVHIPGATWASSIWTPTRPGYF